MMKNIKSEMDYNSLTLTFNDKSREKEYTHFRYLHNNFFVKNFLLFFSVVYFAIFIIDFYFLNIESYLLVLIKLVISAIGVLLYYLHNKISFVKRAIYIIVFVSLVYFSIMLQALLYPGTDNTNAYMVGFSMVVYASYFLIGLRLKDSFVLNMIAQIVFYTLLIKRYPSQANLGIYFFLVQANLILLFSAYLVEKTGRKLFFYINKLESENEKQIKRYKILETKYENSLKENIIDENIIDENYIKENQVINKRKNLLIVDDEKDNVLYFEQVALKLRLNLFKARNGLDAVTMYKKYKSDIALILMDIRMPEMSGYEATKEIKKINKNIPVILITAYSEDVRDETEADLILSKPITPKALINAIKQYI